MRKLKKGDNVVVVTGSEKGKSGKVLQVFVDSQQVIVEKVNVLKKHTKPSQLSKGGILDVPGRINWSNVKLLCPDTSKGTRVGFKTVKDKKVRVARISKAVIDR